MSNFDKNDHYVFEDDAPDYMEATRLLEDDYTALKFKTVGGFQPFKSVGMYGDLDFYFQHNHGEAELTVGVVSKGHRIPSNMFHAELKYQTLNVIPTEGEFEDMFAKLMDALLVDPAFNAEV